MIHSVKWFVICCLLWIPELGFCQSLTELFQSAREQTAAIQERMWAVEIAKEKKDQVTASVLPKLSAQSNTIWRQKANVGAFGQHYQHNSWVSLTQPIFQGGAEYFSLGAAKNLPEIAKLEKRQEELRIFALVAQSFYDTIRAQQELAIYREQEKTLQDQLKSLRQRARIGRSKSTDVIAAQSQLARVLAERSQVERTLVDFKRNLINLTGVKKLDLLIDPTTVDKLQVRAEWQNELHNNPQIKGNELLLKNAEKEISAARGSYLPNLDAVGNYYINRAGILQSSKWDVTLNAKWELYNGGNDSSEVRIQKLESLQLRSRLRDLKRTLSNDFRSLQEEFLLHKKAVSQMQEAVGLAEKNYKQHFKEANQGLVSDLDALRVLEDYLQIRRNYIQQVFAAKLAHVQLRALAGDLP